MYYNIKTIYFFLFKGSTGIFNIFSIPPIGTGVGSSKSIIAVDGDHSKVSNFLFLELSEVMAQS